MNATLIKVGGSLAKEPERLRALCNKLSKLAEKHPLIVVPGGGEFADVVRDFDKRFTLSQGVTHRMAILGMDQYGLLLSEFLPNSYPVNKLDNVEKVLSVGKLPILLPSDFMLKEDPLENSWDVTSDSITAYVAGRLHVSMVLLVTDVDGVYTSDPKKHSDARLINQLTAVQLLAMNKRNSVDKFLPKVLLELQIDCYVVNGKFPERVEAILEKQDSVCTLITS